MPNKNRCGEFSGTPRDRLGWLASKHGSGAEGGGAQTPNALPTKSNEKNEYMSPPQWSRYAASPLSFHSVLCLLVAGAVVVFDTRCTHRGLRPGRVQSDKRPG